MANAALTEGQGAKLTSGWVPGVELVVTQIFGVFETVFGINAPHTGIDLGGMASGTPFVVPDGVTAVVKQAGWNDGYGNSVTLQLPDGTQVLGGHLQDVAVQVGQAVNPGTLLGHIDSTGNSTGTHLHFEVRKLGKPVDPWAWIIGAVTAQGVLPGNPGGGDPFSGINAFFNNLNRVLKPANWWRAAFVMVGLGLIVWGGQLYFFRAAVVPVTEVAAGQVVRTSRVAGSIRRLSS